MADKLNRCGSYLGFRHYFTIDELRLHEGYFCQFEKLCQFCALRRSAKLLRTYSEKFAQVMREQPHLVACMVTFTVKDGPELSERLNHLVSSHGVQLERRKNALRGQAWTEWARAAGGVSRVEIKRGSGSGQWHPHIHAGWLCDQLPDQDKLRDE
ncbi:MAG TPA: protein rep, partial [Acidimicrobiales bacterium]|nr:protein rep [Acidimicrobiales bacterium]